MQATARTDFQHLPRVLQGEDEDSWFGITDPKIRRRLQNRLNQRERRKRLRASDTSSNQLEQQLGPGAESANHIDRILRILDAIRILGPAAINAAAALKQLESAIVFGARCNAWSPAADLRLGVTRLNVLRALHTNLEVLGYRPSDIEDDAQSTFTVERPSRHPDRDIIEAKLPSALRPTVIQRTIPHHPWLDLIPFPCMRDTLILAQDFIDDEQLCQDMSGRGSPLVQQSNLDAGIGETGILVWKDPWDPSGWEVTKVFIQRWGWTLRNCPELLRSTNAWRRYRGERPLFTVSENDMESLLKAGGYLVLLGLTNSGTIRVSNVMGSRPGWWLVVNKGRKYRAVMNPGQWDTILRNTGSGGVGAILPAIDPMALSFSITVSQAVDERVNFLRRPLLEASPSAAIHIESLVIVGNKNPDSFRIAKQLDEHPRRFGGRITILSGLPTEDDALSVRPMRASNEGIKIGASP
ncbi:hypothetical protein CNMCM6069_004802 [Aspergillus lentulus]|nr:hypothetical protein CNMCM6069_004802 [Aspergillus lentulus]KAF4179907.1 hypothetical protein CNMCM7927_001523 [Aspergillus lentulus]